MALIWLVPPNWRVCNIFSPSLLIQLKIPLEGLFVPPIGTFLLKGLNSSFILRVRNRLQRIVGVQVHSTIITHAKHMDLFDSQIADLVSINRDAVRAYHEPLGTISC